MKQWRFPLLVAGGLIIPATLVLGRELYAAQGCAASGGSYDYLRALCFMSGERAASEPHGPLVWLALLLAAKVAAIVAFSFRYPLMATSRRTVLAIPIVAAGAVVLGKKLRGRFLISTKNAAA